MKKLLFALLLLSFSMFTEAVTLVPGDFTGNVTYQYFFDPSSGTYSAVGQIHSFSNNSMWSESSGDYLYFTVDGLTYDPTTHFIDGGNLKIFTYGGPSSVYMPSNNGNSNFLNVQSNANQSFVTGTGSNAPFGPPNVTGTAFSQFKWFVDTAPPGNNLDTNTIFGADIKFELNPYSPNLHEGDGLVFGCFANCKAAGGSGGGSGGNGGGTPPVPLPAPLFLLGSALLWVWTVVREKV